MSDDQRQIKRPLTKAQQRNNKARCKLIEEINDSLAEVEEMIEKKTLQRFTRPPAPTWKRYPGGLPPGGGWPVIYRPIRRDEQ